MFKADYYFWFLAMLGVVFRYRVYTRMGETG